MSTKVTNRRGLAGLAVGYLNKHPELKAKVQQSLDRFGLGPVDWVREEMYKSCFAYIETLDPKSLDVLEVSAGGEWKKRFSFHTFEGTRFPGYDVCGEPLPRQFDLIIADQVFEHVPWPYRAVRNVHAMLKPGGSFVIATPFLIRLHGTPIDCSRWSEKGLSYLLQEGGFAADAIETNSWGNRSCVKANLNRWRRRGPFGSLRNERKFPVMVWAWATKAKD
jgi:SAM-dependent methyltransferase